MRVEVERVIAVVTGDSVFISCISMGCLSSKAVKMLDVGCCVERSLGARQPSYSPSLAWS